MPLVLGPILYLRDYTDGPKLAAVIACQSGDAPPSLIADERDVPPMQLLEAEGVNFWRYDFHLPAGSHGYRLDGRDYDVVTNLGGDLRIAFASCNGAEHGDLDRDSATRNQMWSEMAADHARHPFALLWQGGDQIYADEVTDNHPLTARWPKLPRYQPNAAELEDLATHLRAAFIARYIAVFGSDSYQWLAARLPSLSIWDDHDICDGWGSLPEEITDSVIGQTLFRVAREMYLLFQHGATEADIPDIFFEPTGKNLGWVRRFPGFSVIAPDLRSERRRHQVMGPCGWQAIESFEPGGHTFMISSVPLLGPRLSLIEGVLMSIPKMQKYEDDLRDQWQSRAHRAEWQRMLKQTLQWRERGSVTVISGEIHLATRGEMSSGETAIHQLVASGVTHPEPPKLYARALGALAGFGDAPIADHPIRVLPLPGHRNRYLNQRNYLVLERRDERWHCAWQLEKSGVTPQLALD